MIKLEILKKLKIESFTLFASLPDMGKVGGLTSSFLINQLKAEHVASIFSIEKPWVNVNNGLVTNVIDEYNVHYCDQYRLMIFAGKSQPEDPRELFDLCNLLLDFCQSVGKINRIYTSGGSFSEQLIGESKVSGVVTNDQLKKTLTNFGIDIIDSEISSITWFNGLILGLAKERSIDSIGLYGEISDKESPQPLAAKSVIKKFTKIENIDISIKPFDLQYEEELDHLEKNKEFKQTRPGVG